MMKTNKEYSADELNYFRVCHVTTRIIPDGLRSVFQREWDTHYKRSPGQWQDTAQNGADFYSLESAKNRKKNARLLNIMKDGKRKTWDCTCLFYAILYSDSIGAKLDAITKATVDVLREFRNEVFAHTSDGSLNEADFKVGIQKVITAFSSLKLDVAAIKEIKNQKSFPIEEVTALKNQLQDEKDKTCELEEELNADLKPFSVLPPKPSHDSMERLKVKEIVDKMNSMREEKRDEITVIYLSGNPGSGKSQMARQIGENLFNGTSDQTTDLKFVMTLNAENVDNLLQSYTDFAYRLGCTEYSISSIIKSEEIKLEKKILHLKTLAGQKLHKYSWWLIIVDNVTDLKAVCQYFPHAGEKAWGNGQVLVTTQDSFSISYDSHTFHVPLGVGMAPEEAIAVLWKISGLLGETDIVMKVAEALDFQPLALACAAVYVRRVTKVGLSITWSNYLRKLAEGKRESTEKIFKETSLTYSQTMTSAVRLALEREINDNTVMKHVFQYLSLLAPEPLSIDYIVHYVTQFIPDEDEEYLAAQIATSSLMLYSRAESNEVRVHQIVHYCLKRYIFGEDEELDLDVLTAATLTFDEIKSFDKDNFQQSHYSQNQIITHISCLVLQINCYWINNSTEMKNVWSKRRDIMNCLDNVGIICCDQFYYRTAQTILEINLQLTKCLSGENHPEMASTLNVLGTTAHYQGQYETAKKYYERALGIRETVLGPDHPNVACTLRNLGITVHHQGQYETAKKYFEKALGITETVLGPDHPHVATTLQSLGITANDQGQYETAKKYYERALGIRETVFGPDHPHVASTLHNLGTTTHHQGQYKTAQKYFERALGIKETVLGPDHPHVADMLHNLGSSADDEGQYETAKKYYERALGIRETVFGPDHPDVASTLHNLGTTAQTQGQYETAKKYYERALGIRETVFGPDHPDVASTLHNLGSAADEQGQYETAKKYYQRALGITETMLGPDHPHVAYTLHNLGSNADDNGQYETAKKYFERALGIRETVLGPDHRDVASTLHNLGSTAHHEGQYETAKKYYERALGIRETVLGPDHPGVASTLHNLGTTAQTQGHYETAKKYYERALGIRETVLGPDHPGVASTLNNLGITADAQGQYETAKKYYEKALGITERVLGPEHPHVAYTLHNLGNTAQRQGQYETAKKYYERALAITVTVLGTDHPDVASTLHNLGTTAHHQGQYETAKKYFERALGIGETVLPPDHRYVVSTLHNLGNTAHHQGQYETAKTYYERALGIKETVLGPDHPGVASTLHTRGTTAQTQGQYETVVKYY